MVSATASSAVPFHDPFLSRNPSVEFVALKGAEPTPKSARLRSAQAAGQRPPKKPPAAKARAARAGLAPTRSFPARPQRSVLGLGSAGSGKALGMERSLSLAKRRRAPDSLYDVGGDDSSATLASGAGPKYVERVQVQRLLI